MAEMRWNLAQMVESTDPDWIIARLEEMVVEANGMADRYRGKIEDLDASELFALLELRDDFSLKYEGAADYCRLRYSADSTDPISKRLNEAVRNAGTRAGQALAFMEIELGALLKAKPNLVTDPKLSEYRHYLERMVRRVPHVMTEELEKLTISKDKNGVSAWSQLQGDWLSTRIFKILVDGVEKTMPYGEIISLYQSPDRELRREANRSSLQQPRIGRRGLGECDTLSLRRPPTDVRLEEVPIANDAEPHRQRRGAKSHRRPHAHHGGERQGLSRLPSP